RRGAAVPAAAAGSGWPRRPPPPPAATGPATAAAAAAASTRCRSQAPGHVTEQERGVQLDVAGEGHRLEALAHLLGQGEALELLAQAQHAGFVGARLGIGQQPVDAIAEQEAGLAPVAG